MRAAARAGLDAKVVERRLDTIPDLVLPVVLLLDQDEAVILQAFDASTQRAKIIDAITHKESDVLFSELSKRYSGYAIYVKAEERFDSQAGIQQQTQSEHWFWSVIGSSWRIYRDVLVASFFINLFAIATPLFVMNVYDRVVPNQAIETLWVLAIGVAVVYLFDLLLKGLRAYFIEMAGKKSDILLSAFLFERVMGARYCEKTTSIGAFVSQFREFDTLRNFYTTSSIVALVDIPFILLFLLMIFYVGGALVWVPLLALPFILIYGLVMQRPIKQAVEQTFVSSAQKNATLVESLVALETVKALGAEGYLQRTWERAVGHLARWGQRVRLLSASVNVFSTFVVQLAGVVLIIVGVYLIAQRDLTMGALIASFMLGSRAMGPIAQVASLLVSYDQTKTALGALDNIIAKTQERNPDKPFVKRPSFEGGIQFNKVTFFYPGERKPALENVSFTIKSGEKVAIIGRIGSGKSTVQKLLLDLYQPSGGSVLIDGIDNQQIDPADLRRHVGYVPQDIVLFSGSIKDNIVYGTSHVTDETVIRVAHTSAVKYFVDRHPLGFDRQVGERGEALSGGQRQCIGLARAMLHNPSIFLMDEPTSGMDSSTESIVKNNLVTLLKDRTLILVTHKTSLLSLVDRIIVLDNGKIIADGQKEAVLDALKKGQLRMAVN